MAGRARDILIRFLGDDKDLRKTTQSVANETGKVAKGFSAVSSAVKGLVAAGAVRVLQGMAEAAAAESTEQAKLANVLRNTTQATDAQIASVENWISSMQMATNVVDTDLRQALQSLTVAGMSVVDAQDAISIATDIAAAKGVSLTSITTALVKAQLGSLTGLQRLGIATKNTAGETLTFDQILQGAADTMGGTARRAAFDLAGQLEAVDIAFQEIQENPGFLARSWSRLKQGILLAVEAAADMNNELPQARTLLNELVTLGIDPFEQRAEAMSAVLIQLRQAGFEDVTDAIEFLKVALGTTNTDLLTARANVLEFGAGLGLTADQIREVADQITGALRADAVNRWTAAQRDAAAGTRDFTAALQEQRTAAKEATDPLFASQKAQDRLTDAHDKYTRAAIESGAGSKEAQEALGGLIEAQRDADSSSAALRDSFSGESLTAIQGWADQMGIARDVLVQYINARLIAAGLPPISLPGAPTFGGNTPGFGEGARRSVGGITEPSQGNRGGNVTYVTNVYAGAATTPAQARQLGAEVVRSQEQIRRERSQDMN